MTKSTSPASAAAAAVAAANANFLTYSRPDVQTLQAVAPVGSSSGSIFSNTPFQVTPEWVRSFTLFFTMSIDFTLGAADVVTMSPYAPYSAFTEQQQLGGTQLVRGANLTARYLDEITRLVNGDPAYAGTNGAKAAAALAAANQFSMSVAPGASLSASQTVTVTGKVRLLCQRYRDQVYGLLPLGDPSNTLKEYFNYNLIGSDALSALIVSTNGASTATIVSSSFTLAANCLKTQLLPSGISAAQAEPTVGVVCQINELQNAAPVGNGNLASVWHQEGFIYEKIFNALYDGATPLNPTLVALSPTGRLTDAFYTYQTSDNSILSYYDLQQQVYGRYLPDGVAVYDLESGDFPPIVGATPQISQMTPNANVAASVPGMTPTPAMRSFVEQNSDSGSKPQLRTWEIGLVGVGF